jgi:hypothetical protein
VIIIVIIGVLRTGKTGISAWRESKIGWQSMLIDDYQKMKTFNNLMGENLLEKTCSHHGG